MACPENADELVAELKLACEPLGVHDKLIQGGESGLTDMTLRRWLAARNWVVSAALRDLSKHADWRVAAVPTGRVPESEVQADLVQDKVFLQGCDKAGHSVTVVLVDRHTGTGLEATKKFIMYSLDAGVKLSEKNGQSKVVGILDLEAMGLRNSDFTTLRAIFDLLQNHYVERLHKMYLYCAPTIFYGLWKMVCPFIDPVTKEKVVFVYKEEALAEFQKLISIDVLPTRYNGQAELKPLQKAWEELLQEEQSAAPAPSPVADVHCNTDMQQPHAAEVAVRA